MLILPATKVKFCVKEKYDNCHTIRKFVELQLILAL